MDKKINEILKAGRDKKNLTQEEVSKKIGASLSSVGKWEAGDGIPNGDYMIKLIRLYEIYYDFFPEMEVKKGSQEDRINSLEAELRSLKNVQSLILDKISSEKK